MREQTERDTSLNKTFLHNCPLESDVNAVHIQKQNPQMQTETMNPCAAQMINITTAKVKTKKLTT